MKERLTKDQVFTIPNILSFFRLLLIPLILWLYLGRQNRIAAVVVIAVSGLTDVLDGKIARHFNAVSDLGKFLDPLADKLTQGTLIICLMADFPLMKPLILLFAVKELTMLIMGAVVLRKTDTMNSARWYGKLCTVIICLTMMFLILQPFVFVDLPDAVPAAMIWLCIVAVVGSLIMYIRFYVNLLKTHAQNQPLGE